MTLEAPMRCSALAEQLGEPMIGTVDQRGRWLLIEDRGAWGHDAVADLLGAPLSGALKAAGIRALLVRRREGDPAADAARRVILVDVVTGEMAARRIESLDELEAAEVAYVTASEFGVRVDGPMFLVCSNGKRDACCAVRGRALLNALADGHAERTWECTHLGGHRFAANLVCLPDGIVYGRVSAADGPRLAEEYLAGRLDATALRGRSAWPAPAQVAEQHVRLADGLDALAAVELVSATVDGDRAEVTLRASGVVRAVVLHAERTSTPRPISCRANELEQPLHWQVLQAT